jgi:tellurite resistance protein
MAGRVTTVPVGFFSIVLGVLGLGTCWREAARLWGLPPWIGESLMLVGVAVWAVLLVLYAAKWRWARQEALAEWRHPVMCCFVALIGMTTLLVALAVLPYARPAAIALFGVGALGQLGFGVWRTGALWQGGREPAATTPAMYLPLGGGNFVSAMVAGALGWPALGGLFFGAAIVSVVAIESVIVQRLYTATALAPPLRATMGIQPAPAVVGCVAYLAVTRGTPDLLAQIMLGYGILQMLIVLRLLPWLRQQAFAASYWAYTFAAAALAISAMRFVERGLDGIFEAIAMVSFGFANLVIGVVALGTVALLLGGRLLPPPLVAPAE